MRNPDKKTEAQKLREAAETQAKKKPGLSARALTHADATKLVHELEVHQIELELQNQELLSSKNKLRIEAQKYTELYDFAPMGYFTLSHTGEITELNHSGAKMLGKSRSDLMNRRLQLFISPEDIPAFNKFIEDVFKKPGSQNCEIEILAGKDQKLFAMFHGVVIESTAQCLLTAVDVTQRHLAVQALRESEEKYKTITDSTTDIIFIVDKTGKHLYFNEQVEHILGYKRDALIGRNFSEFVPLKELPRYLGQLSNAFLTKELKHFKTQIYHSDGHLVDVEINGKLIRQKGELVGEGTIKDISEQVKAEAALRKSEERFSLAMDAANDGLWDWDLAAATIYFSPGCYRMLGYEPNAFESTWGKWEKLIHPDDLDVVLKYINNYREGIENNNSIEFRAGTKDKKWCWIFSRGKIVERGAKGEVVRVIGTHVDITKQKHAEMLVQQDHERSLRQRNALSQLMLDEVHLDENFEKPFHQITREVATAMHVEQVSIWLLREDKKFMRCVSQYKSSPEQHSSREILNCGDFPEYLKIIASESKIYSDDAQNDPRFKEFLNNFLIPLEIKSVLNMGVFVEGSLEGVVCIAHTGSARSWHHDEESFATAVAAIVAQTLANIRRKRANDALLEERQRLSNVIQGTNAGTWEWNIQTAETFFSARWAEMLGYTLPEISPFTNQTWNDLSHPDDLKKAESLMEKHFSGKLDYYDCHVRMKHKDGRWIWTLHRGKVISWTEDGKPLLMSGTLQDINDHKLAEEALKTSEQRAKALLDAIPDLMLRVNSEGVFLDYKAAIGEWYYPGENIIGKQITDVVPPEIAGIMLERIAKILKTGKMVIGEYHLNIPQMGAIDVEARAVHGANSEVIIIVRNIGERKKAEAEIKLKNQELEKLNATKDKFFSIIAHDLRSPFNAIVGFSDLLVAQVQDNDLEGIEDYAQIIQKSSYLVMELLANLMDWSRSQTGRIIFKPEQCDLFDIINETMCVLLEIAHQKSIEINSDVMSGTFVQADKEMIATVLRNLITNAIKFTHPGGCIKLSAAEQAQGIVVSVHDNGIGISDTNIKKLFRIDENFTTIGTNSEQGTGLGLVLCKEFIEKHGGQIWIESREGQGSVFSFSLPGIV